MIETHSLTKIFEKSAGLRRLRNRRSDGKRRITAVSDVNLKVEGGEIFGLLGPNGAGKTTLVKMLCTLILPSSGEATVAGHPLKQGRAIRAAVGLAVSDERSFYWRLTAAQNLDFYAALVGLYGRTAKERIEQVFALLDLSDAAEVRVSDFSSGMKQRLAIARSLLHRPQILFLDEPSRSLDPIATQRLHELLRGLMSQEELTIFLITHDLAEAESLCHRLALMYQGRIRALGNPGELRRRLPSHTAHRYEIVTERLGAELAGQLLETAPKLMHEGVEERSLLRFAGTEEDGVLSRVLERLHQARVEIYSIEGNPPSLGEVIARFAAEQDNGVAG